MFVVGGESLIDLVSEPRGADGIVHMHAHQGGSPMNCAIALSKLGNDTGFLCPISLDGFGDYILEPLTGAGVKPLVQGKGAGAIDAGGGDAQREEAGALRVLSRRRTRVHARHADRRPPGTG